MNIKNTMKIVKRAMKRTESYQWNREKKLSIDENFQISYILVLDEKDTPNSVLAYASSEDSTLLFHPLKNPIYETLLNAWEFYFDYDLFQYLESSYSILYMTLETHAAVWREIEMAGIPPTLSCLTGMRKYLQHCKTHNISKNKLFHATGYDGLDVLTLID